MAWLSAIAAAMSFSYSSIALGLGLAKVIGIMWALPFCMGLPPPPHKNLLLLNIVEHEKRKSQYPPSPFPMESLRFFLILNAEP